MNKQSGGVKPKGGKGGAKAVAAVRATKSGRSTTIGAVAVVLLAVAVFAIAIFYIREANSRKDRVDVATAIDAPAVRDGVTVVVGKADAKNTVDVYEDFLCPMCGNFEQLMGPKLDKKIESGAIKVKYHMLPMLIRQSNPPGYSREAANASLCAADRGKFPSFHKSLFMKQPAEGSAGYSVDQILNLGVDVGIKDGDKVDPTFESCVRDGTYKAQLDQYLNTLDDNRALWRMEGGKPVVDAAGKGRFRGTPTVVVNGKVVEIRDGAWIDELS